MGAFAVELRGVAAAYAGADRPAIHGVTLTVGEGEFAALVGPNGAGKTTILEVILGLLPYQAGTVRVFGEEVRRAGRGLRLGMAYLPQALSFPPETPFLARDVVLMGRFGRHRPWRRIPRGDIERARAALEEMGLSHKAGWPVGHLSGGEQRRLLLARALAKGARLLLLDEPLSFLDPEARADLARRILALRARGITVLAVFHEEDLLGAVDRAFLVRGGRVAEVPVPVGDLTALIVGSP
ncbi:metal ABC transporter ATP-binding protein [Candidatus Bipolaricaulota sp. J31]